MILRNRQPGTRPFESITITVCGAVRRSLRPFGTVATAPTITTDARTQPRTTERRNAGRQSVSGDEVIPPPLGRGDNPSWSDLQTVCDVGSGEGVTALPKAVCNPFIFCTDTGVQALKTAYVLSLVSWDKIHIINQLIFGDVENLFYLFPKQTSSYYSVFHRLLITGQSNSDDLHSPSRNVDSKKFTGPSYPKRNSTRKRSKPSKGLFAFSGAVCV
jgi:hypothetical protein